VVEGLTSKVPQRVCIQLHGDLKDLGQWSWEANKFYHLTLATPYGRLRDWMGERGFQCCFECRKLKLPTEMKTFEICTKCSTSCFCEGLALAGGFIRELAMYPRPKLDSTKDRLFELKDVDSLRSLCCGYCASNTTRRLWDIWTAVIRFSCTLKDDYSDST